MKIVLDTNVLVSGLLKSAGNPAAVLTLVLTGAVQICHDKRILAEYSEVLARPHLKFDPSRVRDVLTIPAKAANLTALKPLRSNSSSKLSGRAAGVCTRPLVSVFKINPSELCISVIAEGYDVYVIVE